MFRKKSVIIDVKLFLKTKEKYFESFYLLGDDKKQKNFLSECIHPVEVKRRRRSTTNFKRQLTHEYYVLRRNKKERVCQQFLLSTLDISQRCLRKVINNKVLEIFPDGIDRRGEHPPKNKSTAAQMKMFHQFVESLPVVPSHYCRSSTNKKYLPSNIMSFNNLYRMYEKKNE